MTTPPCIDVVARGTWWGRISLGWTPGCPSVPRIPVEEPGHAGDARKAPGPWRGALKAPGPCAGATYLQVTDGFGDEFVTDGFGHDSVFGDDSVTYGFGHDSITACDRGGGKRTMGEHSRALSAAGRQLRRVARHEGGAPHEGKSEHGKKRSSSATTSVRPRRD